MALWPTPGRAPGRGLASIRDRATLLGGEASVGTTEHDEFAVRAVLPLAALLPDGTTIAVRAHPAVHLSRLHDPA